MSLLLQEPFLLPGSIGTLGTLATAFAIVITALNAMRVGLLTRFMGVLGIIVGVTNMIGLDQFHVLQQGLSG